MALLLSALALLVAVVGVFDISVKLSDMGLDKALENVIQLKDKQVKVGIQAGSGSHDGVDILDIAIYNHFGTRDIPSRPFISDCFDKNQGQISEAQKRIVYRVMEGVPASTGLAQLGQWYQDVLKGHIRNGGWVPNAPATIKRKGSSKPLIDTGQLVNSVRWKIE